MSERDLKSTQDLALLFGLSTRRIEQLTTEGVLTPVQKRPRKYDLLPTVKDYIKHLSDKANGREKKEADSDLETQKLEAETKIKLAKARMSELELSELEGNMHAAEDVEAVLTDHVMSVRSMLMAMPGKLAVDLANTKTAAEASERVKREVYRVLKHLSEYEYDPDEFKKRVRERLGWSERHGEDDTE